MHQAKQKHKAGRQEDDTDSRLLLSKAGIPSQIFSTGFYFTFLKYAFLPYLYISLNN